MKNILIFNGSPRKLGNTSALVQHFVSGVQENNSNIEVIQVGESNLNYCTGCLRCNIIGRCAQRGDDWAEIAERIDKANVMVFASPIYFHHVTAQMKKLIDRFRSFVNVEITEAGLNHKPTKMWKKNIVLIFSMGTSNDIDAQPAIDMFKFMFSFLLPGEEISVIKGTRLAVNKQLDMTHEELAQLYKKINLPTSLADDDYKRNIKLAEQCFNLGKKLSLK